MIRWTHSNEKKMTENVFLLLIANRDAFRNLSHLMAKTNLAVNETEFLRPWTESENTQQLIMSSESKILNI